jgi:hypothetical protein
MKIGVYLRAVISQYHTPLGPVAQLIERVVRNDEVDGLIPFRSTNFWLHFGVSAEVWRAVAVVAANHRKQRSVSCDRPCRVLEVDKTKGVWGGWQRREKIENLC